MTIDPVIHTVIALSFSALFALASMNKWQNLEAFTKALRAYDLIPFRLAAPAALLIATLELATAVTLIVPYLTTLGTLLAVALLSAYAAVMALSLARGLKQIDCGCNLSQGRQGTTPIAYALVFRNLGLAVCALALLAPQTSRTLYYSDALFIAFGVFTLCVYYATLNQLISNHLRYRELR